jgi:hypothetical protein
MIGMRQFHAFALVWLTLVGTLGLGGDFQEASAQGRELGPDTIAVELSVRVEGAQAVVAHVIEPGGDQQTVPLVRREDDRYSTSIELRKADFVVVFEAVGAGGSTQSDPVRLTQMGLDPSLIGARPVTTTVPGDLSDDTRQWGWAGLALGAIALALLAWWALPDKKEPEAAEEAEETS